MKRNHKITKPDGSIKYMKNDLKKRLNLNYLNLTNQTRAVGEHKLPSLDCNTSIIPDYIALYGHPCEYHKTAYTAVGFWQYDDVFDGINGLYNAIYYQRNSLLTQYKERFKDVNIFWSVENLDATLQI